MVTSMTHSVTLCLANDFYYKSAILEAKKIFSQYLHLDVKQNKKGFSTVKFRIFNKYEEDIKEIVLECLNYIMDKSIYIMIKQDAI